MKVAILGAGINGVTCALKVKEKYKDFQVVLISKEFSPDTTGDGSGGLWYPYLCENTPQELLTCGHTFKTYIIRPPTIISRLQDEFTSLGGVVFTSEVSSLRDRILSEFDVIINCTGLGARKIVPDDRVFPIRGQIVKVTAPWVNVTVVDQDTGLYIIPNTEFCVLGGTHQEQDYNTTENEDDTEFILSGCTNMIPSLKNAKVLKTWVGLRPGRDEIRLEAEETNGKLIIHNYGHGGSGLTLFWGCASEVCSLLDQYLRKQVGRVMPSKI